VGAAAGVGRALVARENAAALGVSAAREAEGVVLQQARGGVEREASVCFLERWPLEGVLKGRAEEEASVGGALRGSIMALGCTAVARPLRRAAHRRLLI
jgi:hypothetical protein